MHTSLCLCAHSHSSFVRRWATAVESGIACSSGSVVGLTSRGGYGSCVGPTGTLNKLANMGSERLIMPRSHQSLDMFKSFLV